LDEFSRRRPVTGEEQIRNDAIAAKIRGCGRLKSLVENLLARTSPPRAISLALVLAILATIFVAAIFGFVRIEGLSLHDIYVDFPIDNAVRSEFVIFFIVTWISATALLMFAGKDEREDIYTSVRKQLVGGWTMEIQTWQRESNGKWIATTIEYPVIFSISKETRKLAMDFDQRTGRIFESTRFSTTKIALNKKDEEWYSLFVVVTPDQILQQQYKESPIPGTRIRMPILFDLEFSCGKSGISDIKGQWYDLHNIIMRVMYVNGSVVEKDLLMHRIFENEGNFQSRVTLRKDKSQKADD
jgi:hypothetical protein